MNKRIFELALRAIDFHGAIDIDTELKLKLSNAELEKFAELIVKECISISDQLNVQYLASRKSTMDFDEKNIYAEGEAACDALKYKMKRHFGIE